MRATSLFKAVICVLLMAPLVAAQPFSRLERSLEQYDRSVEQDRARYGNNGQNVVPARANQESSPDGMNQAPARQRPDPWRYVYYQGQWWYFTPDRNWMFFANNAWYGYDASVYGDQSPARFGSRTADRSTYPERRRVRDGRVSADGRLDSMVREPMPLRTGQRTGDAPYSSDSQVTPFRATEPSGDRTPRSGGGYSGTPANQTMSGPSGLGPSGVNTTPPPSGMGFSSTAPNSSTLQPQSGNIMAPATNQPLGGNTAPGSGNTNALGGGSPTASPTGPVSPGGTGGGSGGVR